MAGSRHTVSALLLTISCVVVLSLAIFQWQNPPRREKLEREARVISTPVVATLQNQVPMDFTLGPLNQYSEIVERPLFLPSRRPVVALESSEKPEIVERVPFTLLGVALTPVRMVALLQFDRVGKVVRLNVGEEAEGWTLESVQKDGVILRSDTLTKKLSLKPRQGKAETK